MSDFDSDYSYEEEVAYSSGTDESDYDDSRAYNRHSRRTAPPAKRVKLEKKSKSKMLPNYPPDIDKSNVVKVAKQLLKDREYLMDLPGNDMNLLFTTKTMLDVIEMLGQKCKDLKAENEKLDAELEEKEKHLKMLAKRNANSKKLEMEVRVERLESAVFGTRKEKERNVVPEQKKYDNLRSDNRYSSKTDISGNGSYGNYEHPNKPKSHREPAIQDTSAMNESRRRIVNKPQKMDESQRAERSINQEKPNDDTVLEIIDDSVHMSDLQNNSGFVQSFVAVEKPAGDHARQHVEKPVKLNDLQNSRGVPPSYATEKPSDRVSTRQEPPAPKEKADNSFDNTFRHPSTSFSSFANSSTSQAGSFRYPQTPANRSDSSARVSLPLTPYPGLNPLNFSSPSFNKSRNDLSNK